MGGQRNNKQTKTYPGSFGVFSLVLLSSTAGATLLVGGKDKHAAPCRSTPVCSSTCPTTLMLSGMEPGKNSVVAAMGYGATK